MREEKADILNDGSLNIAIIGMAGRLPGSENTDDFWKKLCAGTDLTVSFSDEDLSAAGAAQDDLNNPDYIKRGAVLNDIEAFDADFFDITPVEAGSIDPQQRVILECAWEALEQGGYAPRSSGRVGVFTGARMNTYLMHFYRDARYMNDQVLFQLMMGNAFFGLSTRLSYKLNLTGPSVSLQSACSTGLVAVHMACQSLLLGESDMALAGAAAINVPQNTGYFYRHGGINSKDGFCHPFDAEASGTLFGNGVCVVLLKPLEAAIRDRDTVYAVIKGSAVNNDGSAKASYTAPSPEGQTRVIMEAIACSGIPAESISYIEAHGTGTKIGDPIEINALSKAFGMETDRKQFCYIGSVKGNIGHLDAASGLAGLIKTALSLKNRKLPPSIHYNRPNPEIDFASSPFKVNTVLRDWPADGYPRRAGVSSFGFGGTNSHIILEEPPAEPAANNGKPLQLFVLSAKTETALEHMASRLAEHMEQNSDDNPADIAHTLARGREAFAHRKMAVVENRGQAVSLLRGGNNGGFLYNKATARNRPVMFLFPGQGSQYINMGLDIYRNESVFREHVDRCSAILEPYLKKELTGIIYPEKGNEEEAEKQLTQTNIAQCAIFTVEYAMAMLLKTWGVMPAAMIGHSIGEYAAACLAGVLSPEDALGAVAVRGRLMQSMPAGAMLSVTLPADEIRACLLPGLCLAADNSDRQCVVSGSFEAVAAMEKMFDDRGAPYRRLHTSHAFHSSMMEGMLEEFKTHLAGLSFHPPRIPYISNISGTWITTEEAVQPEYWASHIRQPVQFYRGLKKLMQEPGSLLLEVGAGTTLSTLARQSFSGSKSTDILACGHHPRQPVSDYASLLTAAGQLWLAGAEIDWEGFYAGQQRRRIPLPTYPFERRKFRIDMAAGTGKALFTGNTEKLPVEKWLSVPVWKRTGLFRHLSAGQIHDEEKNLLILTQPHTITASLQEAAAATRGHCTLVYPGNSFSGDNAHYYTIRQDNREDYMRLIESLKKEGTAPDTILYLWPLFDRESVIENPDCLDNWIHTVFFNLLHLVQALSSHNIDQPVQLLIITSHMHPVTHKEALHPEKALLLGPCRVINQEYPHITCRNLDFDAADISGKDLPRIIIDEIYMPSQEMIIAYRNNSQWKPDYDRLPWQQKYPLHRLREKGTYLITGGLGGIGLTIAGFLAAKVKAKLVLIRRSPFPPAGEWAAWRESHGENEETSLIIQQLTEMKTGGAEILVLTADAADREQMSLAVRSAEQAFGRIDGVIHAAGRPGGGLIQLKTEEEVRAVFAPKVKGTLVLHHLFKDRKPDFMILFSSLSGILGEFGQVDYSGANAFLDNFAHYRTIREDPFTLSVNWDTWNEVGMAVKTAETAADQLKQLKEEQLKSGIKPSEGATVFEQIMDFTAAPQVIVATTELHTRLEKIMSITGNDILDNLAETPDFFGKKFPRPSLSTEYAEPRDEAEAKLAGIWADILGLEKVGINDNFFELGGDSLVILRAAAAVKKAGLDISPQQYTQHQTVAALIESCTFPEAEELESVSGFLPPTVANCEILSQPLYWNPHHFNNGIVLEVREDTSPDIMRRVLKHLMEHHDALRTRFIREESQWLAFTEEPGGNVPFEFIDISGCPEAEHNSLIAEEELRLNRSFHIEKFPLMKVSLVYCGTGKPARLIAVVNHMIFDNISMEIFLKDLFTVYHQITQGKSVQLPRKTTSLKQWNEYLKRYAGSGEMRKELEYWLSLPWEKVAPLPLDFPENRNNYSMKTRETIKKSLNSQETSCLFRHIPSSAGVTSLDIMLLALVKTISRWTNSPWVKTRVQLSGRSGIFIPAEFDLSRTIGYLALKQVLVLQEPGKSSIQEELCSIHEQRCAVPNQGIGSQLLRYASGDEAVINALDSLSWQKDNIFFNFLGQYDPVNSDFDPLVTGTAHNTAAFLNDPENVPDYLDIFSGTDSGRYTAVWLYSSRLHKAETIEKAAEYYMKNLRTIIACYNDITGDRS